MASITLFERDGHRNILLEDFSTSGAVQANQHLVVHNRKAMILDPGGHKVYSRVIVETNTLLRGARLSHIFLSHQDPDIVAAINGWLMTTDATALASELWLRFIPHFGLDALVAHRLHGLPDEGGVLDLDGVQLQILPAHFLHSCGNFHVYDPISKTLYTGDLGASMDVEDREVTDLDAHIPAMQGFHQRYMGSSRALRAWVRMARQLDIETIAPQHGALFRGRAMVGRFLDWLFQLPCGIDLMEHIYALPTQSVE
jgi:flavorubredoxin